MGMLVNGQWSTVWYEPDEGGKFIRPETKFRHRVSADGSTDFPAEAGRYHLYVSYACPWAHRTLILRKLKGLEEVISVSVVNPYMLDDGWTFDDFPGVIPDMVNGKRFLRDVYLASDPQYTGRVTVPVLWDKKTRQIVNNESRMILRMLDLEFEGFAKNKVTFAPPALLPQIDDVISAIYGPINDGVYRTGFAVTQSAYDEAVTILFTALDDWDELLGRQRYLCGNQITEADWCLFTTLLRFDPVYYVHFKCNVRHVSDYPDLGNYLRDLYQHPGIAETCHIDHIKTHYYGSHHQLNPLRIIPKGPVLTLDEPHGRDRLPAPGHSHSHPSRAR